MKQCIKCGELKEDSFFSKGKNQCMVCKNQYAKQYYQDHKKERKQYGKQYAKQYYQNHKEHIKQHGKQYRQDNKEYIKRYHQDHKKERKQYRKQYNRDHKEEQKQYDEQYRQSESGKMRQKKSDAKKRDMKCILLINNPFPCEIDGHHILNNFHAIDANNPWNKWFVIPMPMITHRFVSGKSNDLEHWRHNEEWIRKLYDININELLGNTLEGKKTLWVKV